MADVEFLLKSTTSKLLREANEKPDFLIPDDSGYLRNLKNLVRSNELAVSKYVGYLFGCLAAPSSETRVSVLSLFNYFFIRSHLFRVITVDRLQELLRLCCEIDPLRYPLPPPKENALTLKMYGIKIIKQWHEKFGCGYDKLQNVVQFLKLSKCVDLERATAEVQAERERAEAKRRKAEERSAKISENVRRKFQKSREEFERCITEVDMALKLLVPDFGTNAASPNVEESTPTSDADMARLHGIDANADMTIFLRTSDIIPTVHISEENDAVVQAVRDSRVMLEVHKSLVTKWLKTLTESGCQQNILKDIILVKGRLDNYISKIDELHLKRTAPKNHGDESSDDDSDLEAVPEKELEDFKPPDEVPDYIMKKIADEQNQQDKPCCSKSFYKEEADVTIIQPKKPAIPILPFGLDLKYWGEEIHNPIEIPKNDSDSHRFWRTPDDDGTHKESASIYETRLFTFVGGERRASRQCKAPLHNGKMCPRMDLERCPLHGPIIERDEAGFPLTEQPHLAESEVQNSSREEEAYLKDLEAATGISFEAKKSSKLKRRKPHTPEGRAVRERLEKKLLDKSAIIRVSKVLDSMQKAKIQKKFGSQFAHSLSKSSTQWFPPFYDESNMINPTFPPMSMPQTPMLPIMNPFVQGNQFPNFHTGFPVVPVSEMPTTTANPLMALIENVANMLNKTSTDNTIRQVQVPPADTYFKGQWNNEVPDEVRQSTSYRRPEAPQSGYPESPWYRQGANEGYQKKSLARLVNSLPTPDLMFRIGDFIDRRPFPKDYWEKMQKNDRIVDNTRSPHGFRIDKRVMGSHLRSAVAFNKRSDSPDAPLTLPVKVLEVDDKENSDDDNLFEVIRSGRWKKLNWARKLSGIDEIPTAEEGNAVAQLLKEH